MPEETEFEGEIQSGEYRRSLVALRNLIAHELAAKRCKQCEMLQLRTGDIAALALRLQKVIEDLNKLPSEDVEVSTLDELRARRDSDSTDTPHLLGSKGAQRRQGGRRTSGLGRSGT